MLVLTRYEGESIQIGNDVTITVLEKRGAKTKLGIQAPRHVPVNRTEITERPDFRGGRKPFDETK